MTNKELTLLLNTAIKEKDTIYEFLKSQDQEDIEAGLFNVPTDILKAKLLDLLKKAGVPPMISAYDFDFFDDYIALDIVATPQKLLGKIHATFSFEIESLTLKNGTLKAELRFNELVKNKDLKGAVLNSLTKLKSLLEIALEKIDLPPFTKINIFGHTVKITIDHEKLAALPALNLTFIELKKDAFLFTYALDEPASAHAKAAKQVSGGFLRDMLNNSDRF